MPCCVHRFLISSSDLGIDVSFSPFKPSCVHRFLISGPDLGIDAASSLLQLRIARLQRSRGVQAGRGCHEGGISLSKKLPEWRQSPPQQSSASSSDFRCGREEWFRLQQPSRTQAETGYHEGGPRGGKSTKKATAFNAVAFFLTPGSSKTTPSQLSLRTEPRTRFRTGLRFPRLRPCRRPCQGARHRCRPSWRGRGY